MNKEIPSKPVKFEAFHLSDEKFNKHIKYEEPAKQQEKKKKIKLFHKFLKELKSKKQ